MNRAVSFARSYRQTRNTLDDFEAWLESWVDLLSSLNLCVKPLSDRLGNSRAIDLGGRHLCARARELSYIGGRCG